MRASLTTLIYEWDTYHWRHRETRQEKSDYLRPNTTMEDEGRFWVAGDMIDMYDASPKRKCDLEKKPILKYFTL